VHSAVGVMTGEETFSVYSSGRGVSLSRFSKMLFFIGIWVTTLPCGGTAFSSKTDCDSEETLLPNAICMVKGGNVMLRKKMNEIQGT